MILVSACLIGIKCRYDGTNAFCSKLMDFLKGKDFLPVCPEQLGGLPTPRVPAVLVGGDGLDVQRLKARVINEVQEDVTFNFLHGARKTLELARLFGVKKCYLKEKSPSCGVNWVYKKEGLSRGCGVTAALLFKKGYEIIGL